MDVGSKLDETEWHQHDISFLTSMRMKQEQRNLERVLDQLERQRKRSLEIFEYEKEQTEIDLEQRVRKKSTALSELARKRGDKESIAISRRESLNVLRQHNGIVWNNALGRPTYGTSRRQHPSQKEKTIKLPENVYLKKQLQENSTGHTIKLGYVIIRPQTVSRVFVTSETSVGSLRLPQINRGFTETDRNKYRQPVNIDMEYHVARWIALSQN